MKNIKITSWEDQIICGSLLGSGYIPRVYPLYLSMSACKNQEWVQYKGLQLQLLQATTPFTESKQTIKWRSISGDFWQSYIDEFYLDNKKYIKMDTLDRLRAVALAIWFGDKGFWYSKKRVGLRTTAFGESNEVIAQYFNEVNMTCDIKVDSYGGKRIVFDQEGTKIFLATVVHRLPNFMCEKLICC